MSSKAYTLAGCARLRASTEGPASWLGVIRSRTRRPTTYCRLAAARFLNEMDGNLTAANKDGAVEVHWQGKFRGPDFAPLMFGLKTITHQDLKDTKGRTIPTVMAHYLSDEAKEEISKAARSKENQLLAVIAEGGGLSFVQLATRLGWYLQSGAPNKVAVQRSHKKLKDAKLITPDRDNATVTDKGKKVLADIVSARDTAKSWPAD